MLSFIYDCFINECVCGGGGTPILPSWNQGALYLGDCLGGGFILSSSASLLSSQRLSGCWDKSAESAVKGGELLDMPGL